MRRKKSLVPKIPTAILEHTLSPKSLDALATDYFLELIAVWKWLIYGFWRALTFRGGKRCGTPRPLHPAPLPLSSSSNTDTSLSSSPPVCIWYSLASLGPPRAKHHVWLALDAYASRTPKPAREMQLSPDEEGLLAMHCITRLEMTDVRAGHLLPFIHGNGMSRTSS